MIMLQKGWLSVRQRGHTGVRFDQEEGVRKEAERVREAEAAGRGK